MRLQEWQPRKRHGLLLAVILAGVTFAAPALAVTMRVKPQPGDELSAEPATNVVKTQMSQAATAETAPAKPATPAAKTSGMPQSADRSEPMSERAAAAAARASRALADETDESYTADEMADDPATGQPVGSNNKQRKAAAKSAKCVAGC